MWAASGALHLRRKHGDAILPPLAVSDEDLAAGEIHILDPESAAFEYPEPGPIEERGHEPRRPLEMREDSLDLVPGEDDRHADRPPGADDPVHPGEIAAQDFAIEEEDRAQRLVLGRCAHAAPYCKIGEEGGDLGLPHLHRVPLPVEEDEPEDPADVCLFRAEAVVAGADRHPHAIEELGASREIMRRGCGRSPFGDPRDSARRHPSPRSNRAAPGRGSRRRGSQNHGSHLDISSK